MFEIEVKLNIQWPTPVQLEYSQIIFKSNRATYLLEIVCYCETRSKFIVLTSPTIIILSRQY